MNVQAKCGIFLPAPDSPVIETFLPYLALKAEFLLCSERKAAFDELKGSLQSGQWRDQ
jgi:hypothetical protein